MYLIVANTFPAIDSSDVSIKPRLRKFPRFLGREGGRIKEKVGGVNPIMIYCKH
jgi:hypothetical protein